MEFTYYHKCFGCGEQNPQGLKLKFHQDGEIMRAIFIPQEVHQGYPGLIHGGITSTLLDEVMSWSIHAQGITAVTGRLEIRFREGIPIGQPITLEGWIVKNKGPVYDTEGRIILANGKIAAEAKARFMAVDTLA